MKKLLLFTDSFITGKGGVASYAHDFCKAFHQDFDITVVTADQFNVAESPYGIKILLQDDKDFSITNAYKLLDIIKNEEPAIVVNSGFFSFSLIVPYLPNDIMCISVSHFMNGRFARAAGFNGDYYDTIISLSEYGKEWIEKKFIHYNIDNNCVLYNSIDSEPSICNLDKKIANRPIKIVYPGGHSRQKCAFTVGKALKRLLKTDLDFEFYWTGDEKLPGKNWPFIKTKTIKDCFPDKDPRIKHIGSLPRDVHKQILANANIFLLPSKGEGCPITLMEALRAGCIPIIADARHGSLDIINQGNFGLVSKTGNARDLYDKLVAVISHHDSYTDTYGKTVSYFISNLRFEKWKHEMWKVLNGKNNHYCRTSVNIQKLESDIKNWKRFFSILYWQDRLIDQPRTMIEFRILRYFH